MHGDEAEAGQHQRQEGEGREGASYAVHLHLPAHACVLAPVEKIHSVPGVPGG